MYTRNTLHHLARLSLQLATCNLPLAPSLQLITEISLCESVFLCKKSRIKYNTYLNIS